MAVPAPVRALAVLVLLATNACSGEENRERGDDTVDDTIALPARTAPSPASIGGLVAARTDVEGVVADLVTAEREDGRLTVAVRFRNVSEQARRIEVTEDYGTRWRLVAGGRDWPLAVEPDGDLEATAPPKRTLKPGQSALWRGTFVAPPPGVDSFRLEIPGVRPFEEVPIRDAS